MAADASAVDMLTNADTTACIAGAAVRSEHPANAPRTHVNRVGFTIPRRTTKSSALFSTGIQGVLQRGILNPIDARRPSAVHLGTCRIQLIQDALQRGILNPLDSGCPSVVHLELNCHRIRITLD